MAGSIHLGLYPQCGACADMILRHERVVALYGDDASTSFRGITRPFIFPQLGYCLAEVDGFSLCRRPGCGRCAISPEFVPLHWECVEVFRNKCALEWSEALRRLWVAAAWRIPWRGALPMFFPIDASSSPSLKASCDICEFSQLDKLPLELLQIIQSYSEHASLWRSALVSDLASRIAHETSDSLITMPLKDIVFWERGKRPQLTSSLPFLPLMRIAVDAAGISMIERVSAQPYKGECHNSCAYMLADEEAVSRYRAQLKDGLLRLDLDPSSHSPALWNTPSPPDLQLCRAYEIELQRYLRFRRLFAVDLDRVRGITFFFSHGLHGVHVHRSTASCASSSLQRCSNRRRRFLLWYYLPLADQDRILVLGIRLSANLRFNILVRMQKAGDVVIGPNIPDSADDRCLGANAPITLVYGDPQEGRDVPYFGAYCQPTSGDQLPKRFQTYNPESYPLGEDAYLSMAPLEGIRSVDLFYDQDRRHCRGMILYYYHGGCRAVGQCRLLVDSTTQFVKPLQLCFRIDSVRDRSRTLYTVEAEWNADPHIHNTKGWECKPLEGKLIYWYTRDSSFIAIEK
ncbi:hypothetical protein F5Y18DRAFT_435432 [Xylariaceae sp. FL1019]|nr:hypothetical protein F5Y18DRAFT_435432 [Xylariaceae sp. FL1019]